jgi:ABC-type lipoprotein release transport system permease subunit
MGRVLLVGRLAARNVRRHAVEAALLLLAITAATTTLSLGRVLHGMTDHPYERTREATAGPDVVASVGPHLVPASDEFVVDDEGMRVPAETALVPADLDSLAAVGDDPGVVAHSGPYPAIVADLTSGGVSTEVWAQGHDPAGAAVDRPEVIEGRWVDAGGVVVEAAFAEVLDAGVGDEIALNGRGFRVVGVAVTAAAMPYTDVCFGWECRFVVGGPVEMSDVDPPVPSTARRIDPEAFRPGVEDAGLVWLTEDGLRGLAPAPDLLSHVVNLELADPAAAPAFVREHTASFPTGPTLVSWQDIRHTHGQFVRGAQDAIAAFGSLLTLLALASVAVIVGGRMTDQTRRVGLLKAVGGTPGLVAVVLLAEYLGLAVLAAAAGLGVGWLVAPVVGDPGAGLLGSAGAPTMTLSTVGMAIAVVVGVAIVASVISAVRAARTSTVHALADAARRPRRARWLIALSRRLPVALLLGVRVIARRPRRVLLGIASIAVTVAGIVVVVGGRAAMAADWGDAASLDPEAARANQILLVFTAAMVTLAAVNALVITWAAALDARASSALARALGATPGQVGAGLSAAQVLPALVGAVLGIPAGLALWAGIGDDETSLTSWQLIAIAVGAVVVVAGLTAIPARLGARRPTAEILQAERI